jgi:hypothetical protein
MITPENLMIVKIIVVSIVLAIVAVYVIINWAKYINKY